MDFRGKACSKHNSSLERVQNFDLELKPIYVYICSKRRAKGLSSKQGAVAMTTATPMKMSFVEL